MTATPEEPANPELLGRVADRFAEEFGAAPEGVWFAPGRINLVGAHLDYNGGDVLPLAVDLGVYCAARLRSDGAIRLRSLDQPLAVDLRVEDVRPTQDPVHGWASYVLGVWEEIREVYGTAPGFEMVVGGDVPMASGMSSSAALEIAAGLALSEMQGLGLRPIDLARLSHKAENDYIGVKCGIMDQYASALGRAGHALLIHCLDITYEHVEIHGSGFDVLVMDSKKPRTLAATYFNQRVDEVTEAHRILRDHVRDLPALAHFEFADVLAAADRLGPTLVKRARHVTTEMGRIAAGVHGLRKGDIAELGRALTASHWSTSVDYEVSCDELDMLVETASARSDVFGARLTGAGFGGCAIALVEPGAGDAVAADVGAKYQARFGVEPGFMVLHAGAGPRRVG